jgi:hypothetical protein
MDKPERRMIWGVYGSKPTDKENHDEAEKARQKIIKQYGSFLADTEIDEQEVR